MAEELPEVGGKLSDQQLRFIDEYIQCLNPTKAARRAGYAESSVRVQGHRLITNDNIRAEIDRRLAKAGMPAEEVIRRLVNIATTSVNDFMVVREVQGYEMSEQHVSVLLIHAKQRLAKLEAMQRQLPAKKRAAFDEDWADLKRQILGYEADLEQHGDDVTRLVPWRPMLREVADLDLVALARADEEGRIKTYRNGKEGLSVELYDGLAALRDLARMLGLYEKDNKQLAGTEVIIIGGGSDEAAAA